MCMMEVDSPHPQGICSGWDEPSEYTTAHEHSTSRLIRECWKNTFALEERYS